jgi:hypothetical protein
MHCATLLFNLREVLMCFLERIKHVSQRILLIILLEKCFTPVQGLQNRFAGETAPPDFAGFTEIWSNLFGLKLKSQILRTEIG